MKYDTSELCDIYQEDVNVVEPLFSNFGGRASFGGQIITVKCFEDNGLLYDLLEQNGRGRVLVVDGGGSVRRALVDAELARLAVQNEWEGLVIYGAVRQVDDLEELDIGIQAMAAIPVGAAGEGIGESDVRVNFGGVTLKKLYKAGFRSCGAPATEELHVIQDKIQFLQIRKEILYP